MGVEMHDVEPSVQQYLRISAVVSREASAAAPPCELGRSGCAGDK